MNGMLKAAEVAQRMASTAPDTLEQPKVHFTPLRYVYGSKKRKAKRLASQAKGLYDVSAVIVDKGLPRKWHWHVLAQSRRRALTLVSIWIRENAGVYTEREVRRICGVTAGTKERIL